MPPIRIRRWPWYEQYHLGSFAPLCHPFRLHGAHHAPSSSCSTASATHHPDRALCQYSLAAGVLTHSWVGVECVVAWVCAREHRQSGHSSVPSHLSRPPLGTCYFPPSAAMRCCRRQQGSLMTSRFQCTHMVTVQVLWCHRDVSAAPGPEEINRRETGRVEKAGHVGAPAGHHAAPSRGQRLHPQPHFRPCLCLVQPWYACCVGQLLPEEEEVLEIGRAHV